MLAVLAALPVLGGCLSFHRGAMPGEPASARFAQIDGTRVRFVDEGEGPAVVMLHGFASSLETWAAVMPEVRARHRVLALDLRGFGWTDRPDGDYSPEAQARLVLALMDEQGIERAAFVAHSFGASVALAIALIAPERVTRVALYDAWVYSSQLPTFFHMARAEGVGEALFSIWYGERTEDRIALAFHDRSYVTQALVDDVQRALERPGTYAAALASVRAMHYEAQQARYAEIEQPALLMWGREDRVTPVSIGERLARDLPGARLVVYPGCGHFPMIEHARQSTRELVRFLEADLAGQEPARATSSVSGVSTSGGEAAPIADRPIAEEQPTPDEARGAGEAP
ncbi:MAG: alpha/beta fold hydrolase [Myxococcota bacterium]|nr:alpha/beta fold hydrolase [Myxococcota bacterium]